MTLSQISAVRSPCPAADPHPCLPLPPFEPQPCPAFGGAAGCITRNCGTTFPLASSIASPPGIPGPQTAGVDRNSCTWIAKVEVVDSRRSMLEVPYVAIATHPFGSRRFCRKTANAAFNRLARETQSACFGKGRRVKAGKAQKRLISTLCLRSA